MTQRKTWARALTAAVGAGACAAQAALVNLGDGTVKDTLSNLVWLQDWDVSGAGDWNAKMGWADGLDFAGSSDWALPTVQQFDALFQHYGDPRLTGLFTDVSVGQYWTGSSAVDPGLGIVFFPLLGGFSLAPKTGFDFQAVAVRNGDAAAAVPESPTLPLVLLASGAALAAGRRRTRRDA